MDDLIYRQKTFEILTEYYHHTTDIQHEALKDALSRVPSARSVAKDTNVPNNDLISRQCAIDELWEMNGKIDDDGYIWIIRMDAAKRIDAIPSAQPEQSLEIQDILEYLDTVLCPIISPDNWSVYAELHDMISMLPSA